MEVPAHSTPLEAILKRDRVLVFLSLAGLAVLAWISLVLHAQGMEQGEMMPLATPLLQPWGPGNLLLLFTMWAVMMVAMMLPSAAPMILLFATVNRQRRHQAKPFVPTGVFLLGYFLVWFAFGALATVAQSGLHAATLLSPAMAGTSPLLGGVLLLAAGLYQWTPLKHLCLTHCRSPLHFLMTGWREGVSGALLMGLRHGGYCLGCCWVLMGLLFVAGVMNLLWVAMIGAFVLVEKVWSRGSWLSRIAGLLLSAWGLRLILAALL